MKRISGLLAILLIAVNFSFAQSKKDIVTEKITVQGNCGQCKKRIEDAAYINGVKRAEWNKETKELTLTYRPSKTSLKQVEENIARVGHDAGDVHATDSAYNELPECCAYKSEHAEAH